SVLVRHRVSRGKFVGTPDTLMKLERGSALSELRADGSAVVSQSPVESEVFVLERSRAGRLDFGLPRRLAGSTAGVRARISRDGETVWLRHGGSGSGDQQRNTFVSFDGQSERTFQLPPGKELSTDWSRPVSSEMLYAFKDDSTKKARMAV